MSQGRIIIAGGSGFIGGALIREFSRQGREVVVLTRNPKSRQDGVRELAWDGRRVGEWASSLEGAAAVINLTGKTINCRHTPENLREIISSRVDSAKAIGEAIKQASVPPGVWVQASATGYYGDTKDRLCDETAPAGNDTLAKVCREWEGAMNAFEPPNTRRVCLRIGFVLGRESGALPVLSRLTKLFLGGSVGDGRQYISWIHLADLAQMFLKGVEDKAMNGTYNAVGPNPVTNAEFMRQLRQTLHRPWSPPAPALAVELGARLMGTEPSLALISQRCEPKRFLEAGYHFKFPELAAALNDLC